MARTARPRYPARRALRQIVAECHADLLKYRAVVLASRRPVGIHQTRVALRRLRAALGLFRDAVGPIEARLVRALAAEAKWLAGECGAGARPARFPDRDGRGRAAAGEAHRRAAGQDASRACPRRPCPGARYNAFDGQLAAFVEERCRRPATAGSTHSAATCSSGATQGRAARPASSRTLDGKACTGCASPSRSCAMPPTFLRPPLPRQAAKAYIEATVRLQGALGALNDRAVAAQMLDDIAVAARPTEDVDAPLRQLAKQAAVRREAPPATSSSGRGSSSGRPSASGVTCSVPRLSGILTQDRRRDDNER